MQLHQHCSQTGCHSCIFIIYYPVHPKKYLKLTLMFYLLQLICLHVNKKKRAETVKHHKFAMNDAKKVLVG